MDTKLGSEASLHAVDEGIQLLNSSNHPEAMEIAKDLIGSPSTLTYEWDWDQHWRNTWHVPVPLQSVIQLIGSSKDAMCRKTLLWLLKGWNFKNSNNLMTSTYATIVRGFLNNHDESVIEPLMEILRSLYLHIEEDVSPPKYEANESAALVEDLTNILLEYQTWGVFENLLRILRESHKLREASDFHRLTAECLQKSVRTPDHAWLLMDDLVFLEKYTNTNITDTLVEMGVLSLPSIVGMLADKTTTEIEIDVLKGVLERLDSAIAKANREEEFPFFGLILASIEKMTYNSDAFCSTINGFRKHDPALTSGADIDEINKIMNNPSKSPLLLQGLLVSLQKTPNLIWALDALSRYNKLVSLEEVKNVVLGRIDDILQSIQRDPSLWALSVCKQIQYVMEVLKTNKEILKPNVTNIIGHRHSMSQMVHDYLILQSSQKVLWILKSVHGFDGLLSGFISMGDIAHHLSRNPAPWKLINEIKHTKNLMEDNNFLRMLVEGYRRNFIYSQGRAPPTVIAEAIQQSKDPSEILEAIKGVEVLMNNEEIMSAMKIRNVSW